MRVVEVLPFPVKATALNMVAINNKFIFFIMIIFSLPAKVPLFPVKNEQIRFFLHISSFYSEKYCIFALAKALAAKLVDSLDLGASGLGRVGSSHIRRTEENPNCLIIIG